MASAEVQTAPSVQNEALINDIRRSLLQAVDHAQRPRETEVAAAKDVSPHVIGKSWEAAALTTSPVQRQKQFDSVTDDIVAAAKLAYQQGGMDAVKKLGTTINENIAGDSGPLLLPKPDGHSIDIFHLQPAEPGQTGAFQFPDDKVDWYRDLAPARGDIDLAAPASGPESQIARPPSPNSEPKWGDKIPGAASLPPSPYVFSALAESLRSDLGMDPRATPVNGAQAELLRASASLGPEVAALEKLDLVHAVAQKGDVDKVNAMFARYGIDIHFDKSGDDAITAGGVFQYKASWSGTPTTMRALNQNGDMQTYPAFEKPVKSFNVDGQTVIEVNRDESNGTTMYMAVPDGKLTGYSPYQQAFELTPGQLTEPDKYTQAEIPMMKVRDSGAVPQLLGLQFPGGFSITQAKVATSVDIDQSGAEIKQGVGAQLERGLRLPEPTFKVDRPPLVWIAQDGASKPLIAFQVGQESWKDPKS